MWWIVTIVVIYGLLTLLAWAMGHCGKEKYDR